MVTLVILDGFGEKKQKFGNAIKSQGRINKERDELSVTYRKHGKEESVTLPLNDFIDMVKDEIDNKKLNK